jgi:hypothetical protein
MKKVLLAVAMLAAFSGVARADGLTGSLNIGGQFTTFNSSVGGNVSASGSGQAISAAETDGYGKSFQSANSIGGSAATLGSTPSLSGLTVGASTSQWSQASSIGTIEGNSPVTVGSSIANGSASIGSGKATSNINGTFNQTGVGAGIGVNGNFNVSAIGE